MELSSLPVWAQQIGAIIVTLGTAISLIWAERRKRADEPKPIAGPGDREVVAASFVGTRQMNDAITVLRQIYGKLDEVNDNLDTINRRAHENELIQAAVERIKSERS